MRARLPCVTTIGIYVRISDDRVGSGLGVARQEAECRRFAEARGWTVVDVYVDNDISAYRGRRRPAYLQLLEDLKAGKTAGVVAWHPDRLHRSPKELESFIDVIDAAGATVATVQAGDLDLSTASGRMTARIVGAVARHESEHKSERNCSKHLQLAQAGKVPGGGTRPFGFAADRVTVRESEAVVVRELVGRVASGESLHGLVLDLDGRGIKTPGGSPWRSTSLRRMLISGRIAGLREHRGEVAAEAVWPAIVDRATWEAARRILTDPNRRLSHAPRSYLLTGGLAVCGICEAQLHARPRDDKRRCYVCAAGPNYGGCGKIRALAEPLEDYVVEAVLHRLDGDGLARALAERPGVGPVSTAELASVERQLDELALMFAAGEIGRREWLVARQDSEARRKALAAALAVGSRGSALAQLAGSGPIRERWDPLSFARQRAVLVAAVDRVVVGPAVRGRNFFDPGRLEEPTGGIFFKV